MKAGRGGLGIAVRLIRRFHARPVTLREEYCLHGLPDRTGGSNPGDRRVCHPAGAYGHVQGTSPQPRQPLLRKLMTSTTPPARSRFQLSADTLAMTATLAMLTSLGPLSTDMYLPALPAIAEGLGTTIAGAQLTLSPSCWVSPSGNSSTGRSRTGSGVAPCSVSGWGCFSWRRWPASSRRISSTLTLARFVQALGASAPIVLARAIVRDLMRCRARGGLQDGDRARRWCRRIARSGRHDPRASAGAACGGRDPDRGLSLTYRRSRLSTKTLAVARPNAALAEGEPSPGFATLLRTFRPTGGYSGSRRQPSPACRPSFPVQVRPTGRHMDCGARLRLPRFVVIASSAAH